MGTFGTGAFDSDGVIDLLDELAEEPAEDRAAARDVRAAHPARQEADAAAARETADALARVLRDAGSDLA